MGGYIEYRDERRQRDEEKKTNDIYANCLDQFGVLDITIRKRQQRIYIPCDSSGANSYSEPIYSIGALKDRDDLRNTAAISSVVIDYLVIISR